jgi:hypothetical protein
VPASYLAIRTASRKATLRFFAAVKGHNAVRGVTLSGITTPNEAKVAVSTWLQYEVQTKQEQEKGKLQIL